MPTRTVSPTEHFDRSVDENIESRQYLDGSITRVHDPSRRTHGATTGYSSKAAQFAMELTVGFLGKSFAIVNEGLAKRTGRGTMGMRSVISAALFLIALAAPAGAEVIRFEVENYPPRRAWIDLPDGAKGPVPIVVLVHSFTGTDQRENVMGKALRKAGYATALPDLRTGVYSSEADRPNLGQLSAMTRSLVATLRGDPRFDPKKIALVGFSQGGDIGLILARGPGLVAVVSYYTGCVNKGTAVAVPVQIHLGGKDVATATREECQTLVDSYNAATPGIGEFYLYEGVYHAFNNPDGTTLSGNRVMRGQKLLTQYNAKATESAQQRTLEFLAKQFANQP